MRSLETLLRLDRLTEVVDIGANPIDGTPSYMGMLNQGLCRVTGFEPQPDAYLRLTKKKGHLERYFPYAIGDGRKKTLNLCRYSGWTSFLRPDHRALETFPIFKPNAEILSTLEIETKTLDSIKEIETIDVLKIDVQGSELSCLESGLKKLKSTVFVQVEISFLTLYESQPALGEVDVFMRSQGFVPHCFVDIKRHPIPPLVWNNNPWQPLNQLLEADLIYVRDFLKPESISTEQLQHMAFVAHYCYGSFDLTGRVIQILESRDCLDVGTINEYLSILNQSASG
jgi:FkbM family methyltransferase